MNNIVADQVQTYIRALLPVRTGLLKQLEAEAETEGIPIVQPEVAQLLLSLVRLKAPKRILEVGTATGYSALWLAQGLAPEATLTTIEVDAARAQRANQNFQQWFGGTPGPITLLMGDARAILPTLQEGFDLIFLDAAKGQYPEFLQQSERLLVPGGLLIADNVLFRGMVAHPPEIVAKRYRTIVRRLREFLVELTDQPQWETTILPIGDGVALSYKK